MGVALFFQVVTSDLSNLKNIIELADKTKSSMENNNYPYNVMRTQQIKNAGCDLFKIGLKFSKPINSETYSKFRNRFNE